MGYASPGREHAVDLVQLSQQYQPWSIREQQASSQRQTHQQGPTGERHHPHQLDAPVHQPYGISRIDQPSGDGHHNHGHCSCDHEPLQQHRQGETPPTQDCVAPEQPPQRGVKQQREQQPTSLPPPPINAIFMF